MGNGRTNVGNVHVATFRHEEPDAFLAFDVAVRLGAEAKDSCTDQPEAVLVLLREIDKLLGLWILEEALGAVYDSHACFPTCALFMLTSPLNISN